MRSKRKQLLEKKILENPGIDPNNVPGGSEIVAVGDFVLKTSKEYKVLDGCEVNASTKFDDIVLHHNGLRRIKEGFNENVESLQQQKAGLLEKIQEKDDQLILFKHVLSGKGDINDPMTKEFVDPVNEVIDEVKDLNAKITALQQERFEMAITMTQQQLHLSNIEHEYWFLLTTDKEDRDLKGTVEKRQTNADKVSKP
jgi:hypothetical protein